MVNIVVLLLISPELLVSLLLTSHLVLPVQCVISLIPCQNWPHASITSDVVMVTIFQDGQTVQLSE